jgi:hypothetical protein
MLGEPTRREGEAVMRAARQKRLAVPVWRTLAMTILGAAALLVAGAAQAQKAPDERGQEVLIKVSLLTFNDANVTGNYSVLHAKLAKPFREQFSPERLKETFKSFSEKNIDFDLIAAMAPVATEETKVDDRGVLMLRGYFDTKPSRLTYTLDFIRSDGDWKLIRLHVKLGD